MSTCRTCRFAAAENEGVDGWCHRNPPMVHVARVHNSLGAEVEVPAGTWPPVHLDLGWCGEWSAKVTPDGFISQLKLVK
jgi:hypothetical protein